MDPLHTALELLRRQAEIETAMREPGAIRVTAERELHEIRQTLTRYPGAVTAILEAAQRLSRPVEAIREADVNLN